ncbi:MAG: hypothetical protein WD040_03225 [Anaerolineales bacterium]
MDAPRARPPAQPIGVLASLVAGFDRVASRPAILLPPILLDLFLWFGPALRLTTLIGDAARTMMQLAAADPTLADRIRLIQTDLATLGLRYNLFAALNTVPVGIPSLMASKLPPGSPLGISGLEIPAAGTVVLIWLLLQGLGLALGSAYHRAAARLHTPDVGRGGLRLWARMLGAAVLVYGGGLVATFVVTLVVSLATLVVPLLGVGVLFIGFSAVTWLVIYLAFTPHGMVRYRFGILQAMRESIALVRGNLFGAVGFLSLAFVISYLTRQLWQIPGDTSWLNLLAVFGHAVVSATLLAASYAFYQGRWEWTAQMRAATTAARVQV